MALVFAAGEVLSDEEMWVVTVMNTLFGVIPTSKLFVNVREKKHLCYCCASGFDYSKRVIYVFAGVDNTKISEARREVLEQFECLKKGDMSDIELEQTKKCLTDKINRLKDKPENLMLENIDKILEGKFVDIDNQLILLNRVTKERIVDLANKFSLAADYVLEKSSQRR